MHTFTSRLIKSQIGRKLTISIILFSSLITLITTGFQLVNDYKGDVDRITRQFTSIEKVNLDVLAASIWVIDERLINTQINGLIQLPDITYISIHDDSGQVWTSGTPTPENTIEKTFELTYDSGNDTIAVGSLLVQADLKAVYEKLLKRAIIILFFNAIKTFIVAGFILFLVWYMVARHLHMLSLYCQRLDLDSPFEPLKFDQNNKEGDEFHQVSSAINTMQQQLRTSFSDIKKSKQELQDALTDRERLLALETSYKEELARQVKERTQELEQSLLVLKRAQEVLVEQEKMAALGGLVSGVAHEINTPIGICLTAATSQMIHVKELLQLIHGEDATLEEINDILEEHQESCALIVNNITKASTLIQKFKSVAARQNPEELKTFNLRQALIDSHESMKILFTEQEVEVQFDIAPELEIKTNQSLLKQITGNVLSNSYSHAFKKVEKSIIIIRAKLVDNNLSISIQDNGPGISTEAATHIFEPFYTTSRSEGATGLGLSAAYNAAILLKGNIRFEPECELGGACFLISFPITPYSTDDELSDPISQSGLMNQV
ncbi:sensor histidine kinase [Shewanella violacea]|uniref:histidine kinase n=1 Tax=Shewanella violacea (strain JCM 10179 / CIP 106290 / LMG 19151 / DSS12) TaxID=637905 RepID=D4ZCC5_SHEVD|nr:ATP-binding protein [Shewanella violacea]BAJ03670.1 sensor histidine kinase [Shewanella violacea DSS12]